MKVGFIFHFTNTNFLIWHNEFLFQKNLDFTFSFFAKLTFIKWEGYSLDQIKMTKIGEHDQKLTLTNVNFWTWQKI